MGAILYLIPVGVKFQYEYQKGLTWKHASLYAPFDFPILKTRSEIDREITLLTREANSYYRLDSISSKESLFQYDKQFDMYFDNIPIVKKQQLLLYGSLVLDSIIKQGILPLRWKIEDTSFVRLVSGNIEKLRPSSSFYRLSNINEDIKGRLPDSLQQYQSNFYELFFEILTPNLVLDSTLRKKNIRPGQTVLVFDSQRS